MATPDLSDLSSLIAEQPPGSPGVRRGDRGLPLQAAAALALLVFQQVADPGLHPDELAGAGSLQPFGGAAVRLHLRHLCLLRRVGYEACRGAAPLAGVFATRFDGESTIVMLRPSCFGAA